MVVANLYLISTRLGKGTSPNLVSVGVAIEEDDDSLPFQNVAGTVDWGDGTDEYVIDPAAGFVNTASTPALSRNEEISELELSPTPYKGTFDLIYNGLTTISDLSFDSTAGIIQDAIEAVLSAGETVLVEGEAPDWTLIFDSEATANKIALGSNTLFAPVTLPSHAYPSGNFTITLSANNFRSPTADVVETSVEAILTADPELKSNRPVIIGPVLPADAGFPNQNQWNFNTSVDLQVLVSNIKMILIVEPGERLMMPDYGTALRQFLFNPLVDSIGQDVENEIRRAIETWEPRVKVEAISFTQSSARTLSVSVSGVSKLNQERFQLNTELER